MSIRSDWVAATVRSTAVKGIVLLVFPLLGSAGRSLATESISTPVPDPRISIHEGFADEKICVSCHGDQAADFAKSHHAKAMAIADEKAVRGDFNNARFEHDGVVAVFSRRRRRRDGRFFVTSLRPLGRSFGRRPGELPRGHPKALGRPSVEPVLLRRLLWRSAT
jgi:hypothetical protein